MIKPIAQSDLPDCLSLLAAGYEESAIRFGMTEANCPYRGRTRLPFSELEKEFLGGYQMYGYYCKDRLVGFLSLREEDDALNIHDLVILPEYRRHGFGSELIRFAKQKAGEHKHKKITLGMIDDNHELKQWYEKHGFQTVERKQFDMVTYIVGKMEFISQEGGTNP